MKYQAGDCVIILATNEEGRIIEPISKDMFLIESNGIQFPVFKDQIDFPYFKMFSEKKLVDKPTPKKYIDNIKKEQLPVKEKIAGGVWLSFFPSANKDILEDNIVEKIKIYLINQNTEPYNFIYKLYYSTNVNFQLANIIASPGDFYLHDIPFENISDNPLFHLEFSLVTPDKKKASHYERSLKLRGKQVFKRIEEMYASNEASFSYLLFEQFPLLEKKETHHYSKPKNDIKMYDASQATKNISLPRSVIDLHIEKLTDDWKHLSNFEILTIQLKTFENFYELSVVHMQPVLTVIHGIGTGKLRDEIHQFLSNKKEVKSYVNRYHPNYGYGSTEIFFSYT